jgi:hypothetical protein
MNVVVFQPVEKMIVQDSDVEAEKFCDIAIET